MKRDTAHRGSEQPNLGKAVGSFCLFSRKIRHLRSGGHVHVHVHLADPSGGPRKFPVLATVWNVPEHCSGPCEPFRTEVSRLHQRTKRFNKPPLFQRISFFASKFNDNVTRSTNDRSAGHYRAELYRSSRRSVSGIEQSIVWKPAQVKPRGPLMFTFASSSERSVREDVRWHVPRNERSNDAKTTQDVRSALCQ